MLVVAYILVDRRGWPFCRLWADDLARSWTNTERLRTGTDLLVLLEKKFIYFGHIASERLLFFYFMLFTAHVQFSYPFFRLAAKIDQQFTPQAAKLTRFYELTFIPSIFRYT